VPGLSGELIVADSYAYSRGYGATKYSMSGASTLMIDPTAASGPLFIISQMVAVANDPGSNPVLVGTDQEMYGLCYHIRVTVTQSSLSSKLSALQTVQALGGGTLDLWITTGDFQLERLDFSTTDQNAGAAAARIVLSNWNNVGPIKPPPASQFDIPGLQSIGA